MQPQSLSNKPPKTTANETCDGAPQDAMNLKPCEAPSSPNSKNEISSFADNLIYPGAPPGRAGKPASFSNKCPLSAGLQRRARRADAENAWGIRTLQSSVCALPRPLLCQHPSVHLSIYLSIYLSLCLSPLSSPPGPLICALVPQLAWLGFKERGNAKSVHLKKSPKCGSTRSCTSEEQKAPNVFIGR